MGQVLVLELISPEIVRKKYLRNIRKNPWTNELLSETFDLKHVNPFKTADSNNQHLSSTESRLLVDLIDQTFKDG